MDKLERLLNLTAALQHTARPLTRGELRERLAGAYPDDDEASRRMFERDKSDLRDIGVPIEVSTLYHFDPPTEGYRIRRSLYANRDLRLDPDELAALHLATSLVRFEGGVGDAFMKLGGPDRSDELVVEPVGELPFDEALSTLMSASLRRRTASFAYHGSRRELEPWRLSFYQGYWYVIGWDVTNGDERLYRVDRIEGEVVVTGAAAHPVGRGPDPSRKPWEFGGGEGFEARLLVDADQANWACYRAGVDGEYRSDGSVELVLQVRNTEAFRALAVDFLEHAEVLEPQWLREDFVARLESLL